MKKLFLILTLILFIFAVSGCAGDEDDYSCPEGMVVATSEAVDYYFFCPDTWRIDRTDGMISAVAGFDPATGLGKATVSGTDFKVANDITNEKQYVESILPEYEKTMTDFVLLDNGTDTIASGEYPRLTYTATLGGVEYKHSQVFIYNAGRIYILTYTAKTADYDTYSSDFDSIVESFRGK